MGSPAKLPAGVLVLSPFSDSRPQAFKLGQMAMRVGFIKKMMPIFPVAYCAAFMTQEDLARRLRIITLWWWRRCGRIWLCTEAGEDYPELDPLTHDVLLINEGLMTYPDKGRHFMSRARLPVHRFRTHSQDDGSAKIDLLRREEISYYLRCNLTGGLFRGMEA